MKLPHCLLILLLATTAAAQDESAYDRAVESTVRLRVIDARGRLTVATGVVVGEGKILTAHHAVHGAKKIYADAPIRRDGAVIADPLAYTGGVLCTLLSQSPERDLALLKAPKGSPPLALAPKTPAPGAGVFTIGNGPALFRYAGGCVRQTYAERMEGNRSRMIECALANSVGDSGGPVINRKGELVGIISHGDLQSIRAVDLIEIRLFLEGK